MSKNAIAFPAGMGDGNRSEQGRQERCARQEKPAQIALSRKGREASAHKLKIKKRAVLSVAGGEVAYMFTRAAS